MNNNNMSYKYINTALTEISKLTRSYANEWDHVYGMFTFEFYPNKMTSVNAYLEKNGIYENMILDDKFAHELLRISGIIRNKIELDDTVSKLPDQLLFTIDRATQQVDYHFVYDIADNPNYSSFDEMLYFEYHLMGLIPESKFNRKLLNNALLYHGEKPLD